MTDGRISYAGIYLPAPDAATVAWAESALSHDSDLYPNEWSVPAWPGMSRQRWALGGQRVLPPVRLGRLRWPSDASRWATFHGLVTSSMLEVLRPLVYRGEQRYRSYPLVLGDARYQIETTLWMLPPRPIDQIRGEEQLYLLTLVDDRYFWWDTVAGDPLTVTVDTSWDELLDDIATELGIAFTYEELDARYAQPSQSLISGVYALPLLLDAVAYNVGRRVVRDLEGEVSLQTPQRALELQKSQAAKWPKLAGGRLALDRRKKL